MRRLAVTATVFVVLAAAGAQAKTQTYRSPGYRGTTKIPKVTPVPIAPVTLGTGKFPAVLVDPAGTGHILFAQDGGGVNPDAVTYCRLARGQKACGASATLTPQAPAGGATGPFEGNLPSANQDTEGPIPLDQGNALYLVDHRFPDTFAQPGGGFGADNTFLWASQNGGQTFDDPVIIGDNKMSGGAAAYGGEASPSIATITRTETGGTVFQGIGAGQFTTAKALLGPGDQAYDGSVAADGNVPVAAFDDLTPTTYVREWTGIGSVNDPTMWTSTSFPGASPRIAAGPSGVFVLYRDSLTGGNVLVRKIVGGQPSGSPVKLSGSVTNPTISENAAGGLAVAWVDQGGVELRSSSDGVTWSPAQLLAAPPSGGTIGDLALAATGDGGGFATFIENPVGAEGVGTVAASVFGSQQATGKAGLGQLPGGGIGSPMGDQLATSTCTTAKFGAVTAEVEAGCYAHDKSDPDVDVSLGSINLNGLEIVPDVGVRIAINPKQHEIDTSGTVSVLLKGQGLNLRIFRGELHIKLATPSVGTDLFDFPEISPPVLAGFPIEGDIDVKLVNGGVQIPISLKLPGAFGGITGSAVLTATLGQGLNLDSVEFKVGDVSIGAAELKDLDIKYQRSGNKWSGTGTVNVPTGGKLFSLALAIEFDNGAYKSGSFVVGLPYPGVPMDLNDTPPQLYLSKGGLSFGLDPVSLGGTIEFGITPLYTTGGADHDYAFTLDGGLTAAFGNPVTLTVTATGFLYQVQIAAAKLVYELPDTVKLTGTSGFDLGVIKEKGTLQAIIDPKNKVFGGRIKSDIEIELDKLGQKNAVSDLIGGTITIPSEDIAINNKGFAVYIPPTPPIPFVGTIAYDWGDTAPHLSPLVDDTDAYSAGLPATRAVGAPQSFMVPAGAPAVSVRALGDSGAPAVVLTDPGGAQVTPGAPALGAAVVAVGDGANDTTEIGLTRPAAGRWTVSQAPGTDVALTGLQFAVGEAAPTVTAKVSGHGAKRTLTYHVKAPHNVTVGFAEQTGSLFHQLGQATRTSGHLTFTPAVGKPGRRSIVALIDNGGLPHGRPTVASYVAPAPLAPGRAKNVRITAGAKTFTVRFSTPPNATHVVAKIVTSDGRHIQRILGPATHTLAVAVIGFKDAVKVTIAGVGATGRRGPSVSATATRAK